jgi:hypothetical protein
VYTKHNRSEEVTCLIASKAAMKKVLSPEMSGINPEWTLGFVKSPGEEFYKYTY